MKMDPGIRVVRTPYEEPYQAHITIFASNGSFSGEPTSAVELMT